MSAQGDQQFAILMDILHQVDEPASAPLPELDHVPDPWENSVQATCECLSWRGTLDNLERRHAEDRLGETVYAQFPVRSRSAVVVTHTLIGKGVISEDELRAKMQQVRSRIEKE
jgi:hypothetical protein